ncbi:MAG TPA: flagellar biosynthesis protein FlhB [Tepidisphaeraceae bacterium]|jgi:flagellar biosynthetic protein FlhB|nr:flagellar biosynthesis protein FlhB [Tepidisphaeraceae bacterium]
MAEDNGDKTEAPTPRRRQEARDQGQIARSQDLTAAVLLLTTLLTLNATGSHIVGILKSFIGVMLGGASLSNFDTSTAIPDFVHGVEQVGVALAPLLAATVIAAIVCNMLQVGLVFNTERLTPNFAALNPVRGWSKMFGQGGVKPGQMALNVLKLIVLSAVAYSALHGRIKEIVTSQRLAFSRVFYLGAQVVYSISLRLAIALLIIAIIEYIYRRWKLEEDLKMSKQEVKEEMRSMDGDPKMKQRRRQVALQRLQQKLKKDVPTADVVVTNPTHYAVALKYDPDTMHAPRVVAKGADFLALRIREIAVENGVPILERKPLARALYQTVDVGKEIPEEFYSAIAEILAYVYELSGKSKRRERTAPKPVITRTGQRMAG